ncbi:MAG: SDR family NAD(P)-dependent oxidoreductase [Thiotrichales bacterium]|nr:SDR family NAD(P)-dependent oxidoreductase [Thiotrichales bacterium]
MNANRIAGQTALITGATSGFGWATAWALANMQVNLLLLGRRSNRLEALATQLRAEHPTLQIETLVMDVRDYPQLQTQLHAFMAQTPIDILINNAGLAAGLGSMVEGDVQDWEQMIDTNLKGLLYVSRTLLPQMQARNRGHIINIGSMAGNQTYPNGNVYCATKAAVHVLGQAMNMDLLGSAIRVCTLAPGAANTEFSTVRFHGDQARANQVYQGFEPLLAEDIAEMILYVLNAPPHVNIQKIDMMPTAQRSPYHLHQNAFVD